MPEALRLLVVAFRFLTRLPLPHVRVEEGDLRRAAAAFPLVGLAVAGAGVAVRAASEPLWGSAAATVAALGAMVLVTGALHEDGLADTVDGLWGGWDREQRLAAMRDSRVGTYGVVALALTLALRVTLLTPLDLADFTRAVTCGHVLGRAGSLLLARLLPAASPGLGAQMAGSQAPAAALLPLGVVALTLTLATGAWAPLPLLAALAATAAAGLLFRARLGGITGDTLGATIQVVELVTIAAVAALARAALV